jgi:hypothetical protein
MINLTYLAAPYSHPDRDVRIARFKAANRAARRLMKRGDAVFSPISHSHPIEDECGEIEGHEFWAKQDDGIQACANRLAVLMLDGWKESKGTLREIELAEKAGIAIEYLEANWGDPFVLESDKRVAETGAQRNNSSGKGRFDLLPIYALFAVARVFEDGAKEHGENNWRRGMPTKWLYDSGMRHLAQALRGDTDEDHLAKAAWNILCAIENRDDPTLRALQEKLAA